MDIDRKRGADHGIFGRVDDDLFKEIMSFI